MTNFFFLLYKVPLCTLKIFQFYLALFIGGIRIGIKA